jgi:hypothetical protein
MDVVLLRRRETLAHLPGLARLCGAGCGPGVTVLRGPSGAGRLVVELSRMPGVAMLDAGRPLPSGTLDCLAATVAVEASGREAPPCAGPRRLRFVLP